MKILTTHTGSLPRRPELVAQLAVRRAGEAVDEAALLATIDEAMFDCVSRQIEVGIDIVNDGEQSKTGFQSYVAGRMSGFEGRAPARVAGVIDAARFPSFGELRQRMLATNPVVATTVAAANGEIRYHGESEVDHDCAKVDETLKQLGVADRRRFMSAASPGIVAATLPNQHYDTVERYMFAVSDALSHEYKRILDNGFDLQIDAPDIPIDRNRLYRDMSDTDSMKAIELHVSAINRTIEGLPKERIRVHACWGNYEGPHMHDVELKDLLPVLRQVKAGAIGLPFGNPRHGHEIKYLKEQPLPDDMKLIAGVIDTTTNYVEHPELVAERLVAAVKAMGDPSRVLASPDCGFETQLGIDTVAWEVTWEKLRAMVQGAELASREVGATV